MSPPVVVWFRQDLRLTDNPALRWAVETRRPVIAVYIRAPEEEGAWPPGGASKWWLHRSLSALADSLEKRGSRLILRQGGSLQQIQEVIAATGADTVVWNRRYEPAAVKRDRKVESALRKDPIGVRTFNAALLFEPGEVANKQGNPFQVFTPFWKHCLARSEPAEPLPAPRAGGRWAGAQPALLSADLNEFELEPKIDWAGGLRDAWTPGERGAKRALEGFLDDALDQYDSGRDRPDRADTSRLSPYLHFGEISPRQLWHAIKIYVEEHTRPGLIQNGDHYLRQVGWREFAHHLLVHFPHTDRKPLRANFDAFPWERNAKALRAWQQGRTGYPIVDAGMRELWRTGWMHNRVRMIAASFLVKDLLIPWQEGAKWFWDTLVDADLANNSLGWQWTAGCGADAAPYFRIFNPVTQGEKFDPEGAYVRTYIPELREAPSRWIHKPWESGMNFEGYPPPLVDHAKARLKALEYYDRIK